MGVDIMKTLQYFNFNSSRVLHFCKTFEEERLQDLVTVLISTMAVMEKGLTIIKFVDVKIRHEN